MSDFKARAIEWAERAADELNAGVGGTAQAAATLSRAYTALAALELVEDEVNAAPADPEPEDDCPYAPSHPMMWDRGEKCPLCGKTR